MKTSQGLVFCDKTYPTSWKACCSRKIIIYRRLWKGFLKCWWQEADEVGFSGHAVRISIPASLLLQAASGFQRVTFFAALLAGFWCVSLLNLGAPSGCSLCRRLHWVLASSGLWNLAVQEKETRQNVYLNCYSLNTFLCGVSWLAAWSLSSRTEKTVVLEVLFLTVLYIAYVAKIP